MKRVCGTCIFNIDSKAERSSIYVVCAFDNESRRDSTEGCNRWKETTAGLSKKDRIDLANKIKEEQSTQLRHQEVIQDSKEGRKFQVKLLIFGALLGVIGTLFAQYIWSLWTQ